MLNKILFVFGKVSLFFFLIVSPLSSQINPYSSANIFQSLKKLKVLGSVLYIAAHPDDENTSVLTYMSKAKHLRTGYLSLTRGDGGQNLLGKEKGDMLGVVRTQELISAREIDGAEQFFTRAIDFGYSKTAEETLQNWDRDILLGDVVKVIREFKPDVLITRFSKTQGGHGQHLASAILAEDAFFAAADPTKYPEQLKTLELWQPTRLYWNTWQPTLKALSIDIGEYNSILGNSYNELSAQARSMHKSQGFGVSPTRGEQLVHFDYFAGDTATSDLLEGINLNWSKIEGGKEIEEKINSLLKLYEPSNPKKLVSPLIELYKHVRELNDNHWVKIKLNEIKELIKLCAGLWFESKIWEPELFRGNEYTVRSTVINRSGYPMNLESIKTSFVESKLDVNEFLELNKPLSVKQVIKIPEQQKYSRPFWLEQKHDGKFFTIEYDDLIGPAENNADVTSAYTIEIENQKFTYLVESKYKWNDAVDGEKIRPIVIVPEVSISANEKTLFFPNGTAHDIHVTVLSKVDSMKGKLVIELPKGWNSNKYEIEVDINEKNDRNNYLFNVQPSEGAQSGNAKIKFVTSENIYEDEIIELDYPHIKHQTVLRGAEVSLIKLEINVEPKKIGYIMGSGDEIPNVLSQIGYELILLSDKDLDETDLSQFDVIICGIRAFNTREELGRQQKRIIDFVEDGGTWIVQHNTRFGIQVDQIGPYPFIANGRDRIAQENAKIDILVPNHQIFNYPNKISEIDFNNWVQERGLYFANSWEGKLYPLLAGNDDGEPSKLGGLLYTKYGKGVFIFTAYSWFRQLPAGVPGAIKLFVNMISAKGEE